jgi:hypothetical protein
MICDGDGDGDLIDAICIKTDEPVPISVTVSRGNDEDCGDVMTSYERPNLEKGETPTTATATTIPTKATMIPTMIPTIVIATTATATKTKDKSADNTDETEECSDSDSDSETAMATAMATAINDCESVAYISNYPVQMICLEKCENTTDYLLENELIDEPKCISALMQIVMTLIVYQKTLSRITIYTRTT